MAQSTPAPLPPLGSVLVTGGCGFLGTHLVRLLLERYPAPSTSVSVLDLHTSRNTHAGATYHSGDITSPETVRAVFESVKPIAVIHTASPVFWGKAAKTTKKQDEALMRKVNVEGTRVLLEEAKRAGVKVFVYTSSASIHSDARHDLVNADERWEVIKGSIQPEYYTNTKAQAEELVLAATTRSPPTTPFLTTSLRPAGLFGEHDMQYTVGILGQLHSRRTNFQLGTNDNLWDYTYVGNAAHAHILAVRKLLALTRDLANDASLADEQDAAADAAADDAADARRVDGRSFVITNASPTYWWDLPRALWTAYAALSAAGPAALRTPAPTPPSSVWALSREVALALSTVAEAVGRLLRRPESRFVPGVVRFVCMTRYFSVKAAERALDYRPVWTLEEGVQRTVEWFWERDLEAAGKKGR